MSVYSRCVDARGTISIVSTLVLRHASKPVFSSRRGSGPWVGGPGCGLSDDLLFAQYGLTVKPYSDWIASDGTTGLTGGRPLPGGCEPPEVSLSSATAVSTRRSTPC